MQLHHMHVTGMVAADTQQRDAVMRLGRRVFWATLVFQILEGMGAAIYGERQWLPYFYLQLAQLPSSRISAS